MHALLRSFRLSTAIAALVATASALTAASDAPGYVDLGQSAPPADGGTYVEVNIPRNLIAFAVRLTGKDEPDIAQLLDGLQSIHVNVVSMDDSNTDELHQRAARVLEQVERDGWHKVVTVREDDEHVDVYVKIRDEEVIEGVTVVVMEGDDEAVFVNIVGDIRPEQIALVGERFGIDPLKEIGVQVDASL